MNESPFNSRSSKTARSPDRNGITNIPQDRTTSQKISKNLTPLTGKNHDLTPSRSNTQPQKETNTNMDHKEIQRDISSFVPEFNGEETSHRSDDLTRFLGAADSIYYRLATDNERQIFSTLIKFKLSGDAYTRINNRQVDEYETLRKVLNSMYTKMVSLNELERDFTEIKQTYGETIRNYGYRLIEAMERYKKAYKSKYQLTKMDQAYTNHLEGTSVQSFKRGLNNTVLKEKVATSNAKTVDEIIDETEYTEKMLNMTMDTTNTHQSKWTNSPPPQMEKKPNQNVQTRTNQVICNYCNKPNHTWDVCRIRQTAEAAVQRNSPYKGQNIRNNTYQQNRPQNSFNRFRQPQSYQYNPQQARNFAQNSQPFNNNRNPKYCSYCKVTTSHTFDECRNKFFNNQNYNTQNFSRQPQQPDISQLEKHFTKMKINSMYTQPQEQYQMTHQMISNDTSNEINQGNSIGSNQI